MKTPLIAIIAATAAFAIKQDPKPLAYELDPPAFPADAEGTVCMHFMPAQNNFAANVNVMAQNYKGTLESYNELNKKQLKQVGFTVLRAELKDGLITYEYTGRQQNLELRWYSQARKSGDKVYLVTATALRGDWEEQSESLIASVQSFALKNQAE